METIQMEDNNTSAHDSEPIFENGEGLSVVREKVTEILGREADWKASDKEEWYYAPGDIIIRDKARNRTITTSAAVGNMKDRMVILEKGKIRCTFQLNKQSGVDSAVQWLDEHATEDLTDLDQDYEAERY